ncbi:MAG: hypothetical protein C7B46_17700 [Sulfobacillus benefaciens]|uniref:Uncharacterized protein n=1 Tax=Sulfobacillus benefaciens TaxID=453960 RepID=A0A2T2X811_9FIRM|nr:MAG: hypothetical protein C7B46_17700 [Sulfobacillus benefaciens]
MERGHAHAHVHSFSKQTPDLLFLSVPERTQGVGKEAFVSLPTAGSARAEGEKESVKRGGPYTSPYTRHSTMGLPLEISCPQGGRCGYGH